MIHKLAIRNYKNFVSLEIPTLKQLNLFVGDNNVGKSNLLEAVLLYCGGFNLQRIHEVLKSRHENLMCFNNNKVHFPETQEIETFIPLLPNRDQEILQRTENNSIVIGSDKDILRLSLVHAYSQKTSLAENTVLEIAPYGQMRLPSFDNRRTAIAVCKINDYDTTFKPLKAKDLSSVMDMFWLEGGGFSRSNALPVRRPLPCMYLECKRMTPELLEYEWGAISLTGFEDKVVNIMQMVMPTFKGFNVIRTREGRSVPYIRTKDNLKMPLAALGDGVTHILNLVIACMKIRGGILLLDETESGLHYSSQTLLWQILNKLAKDLQIQIFATTHSMDCISAFANTTANEKGQVTRLDVNAENIVEANTYRSLEDVLSALKHNVEIR